MLKKAIFLSTLIICFNVYAQATNTIKNVEQFFKQYTKLGDSFDSNVANLYADTAKILSSRRYPLGFKKSMELTGREWKKLVIQVMPYAKLKNDKSTYKNVQITNIDKGYKIKANRYSELKCYTDSGYYMIVRPNSNGDLKIIEEYSETKALSDC